MLRHTTRPDVWPAPATRRSMQPVRFQSAGRMAELMDRAMYPTGTLGAWCAVWPSAPMSDTAPQPRPVQVCEWVWVNPRLWN